ncbi:Trehalose-6-P synthase/phosphatase complex subunit [Coemansia sp. Benny D115]|nr:Trehalose-6-P synthase/phosphatase complex subunit [Coemansia sp. Benny D115]
MEPRVLVVSLFAPYSVNFDAPATRLSGAPSSAAFSPRSGINSVHERQMSRSGSTGRNSIWNGRRSSVHRTHTTPLGHHGQPHSRRRSTFSIKLAPTSRKASDDVDATMAASVEDTVAATSSLATCNEEGASHETPKSKAGGQAVLNKCSGASQLAYNIDEAAGAHTPPINTLDFTRKHNLDLVREKQERKAGAGKHGRLLREHRIPAADPGQAHIAPVPLSIPSEASDIITAAAAVHSPMPMADSETDSEKQHGQDKKQDDAFSRKLAGLHIETRGVSNGGFLGSERKASPEAMGAVPGTNDQFVVEHLNVGNIGLFNAVNASLDLFAERVWIGELGISTEDWSDERKQAVSNKLLDTFETLPVFVSDSEFEGHYGRFSKQLIWPAFHYIMPEMPQWHGWEKSAYEASLATCQRFADRIAEIYREGDIIWVNDYHLMLLPKLIRERLPNAHIGFFLHIPFPSSEIFRCLHVRRELLEGMLGADVVGLQTFAYKRHFVHTAKRVLGVDGSPSGLTLDDGRHVVVGQYAMGLDPAGVEEKWSNVAVGELIEFLNDKYAGNYLLVGRDKLDHVKGVRQKLLGYECFLSENPDFASKTVLIQIALTTAEHNELQVQVMDVVNRINSKFGTIEHQPVVFFHKDIPYSHYLALLSTADAMIITSLRDGMNLTSHEYVLCQREKNSPLILSEFVGTYGAFSGGALEVNPMDTKAIAQAIKDALVMSQEEKMDRWNLLHRQVLTNSATSFVSSFVSDIESAHAQARSSGSDNGATTI